MNGKGGERIETEVLECVEQVLRELERREEGNAAQEADAAVGQAKRAVQEEEVQQEEQQEEQPEETVPADAEAEQEDSARNKASDSISEKDAGLDDLGRGGWKELSWKDRYVRLFPHATEEECQACLNTFKKKKIKKQKKEHNENMEKNQNGNEGNNNQNEESDSIQKEWKDLTFKARLGTFGTVDISFSNSKTHELCKLIGKSTKQLAIRQLGTAIWQSSGDGSKEEAKEEVKGEEASGTTSMPPVHSNASILKQWTLHQEEAAKGTSHAVLHSHGYVKSVCSIHVGGTCCVIFNTDNKTKIQVWVTLSAALVRACLLIFFFDV